MLFRNWASTSSKSWPRDARFSVSITFPQVDPAEPPSRTVAPGQLLGWRTPLLCVLFLASLQPLSVEIGADGVFVGYLFLTLLVVPLRQVVVTHSAALVIAVYSAIFLVGAPRLITGDPYYSIRVCASFFAFVAPFLLLFVRFEKRDLGLFKSVVIVAAVYYAVSRLYVYGSNLSVDVFSLRGIVGSQRYGFVLCLAFFLALYSRRLKGLTKASILGVLLCGCLLTFSRATFVALGGAGFLAMLSGIRWGVRLRARRLRWTAVVRAVTVVALVVVVVVLAADRLRDYWSFIDARLIAPALSGELFASFLSSSYESSEGARAYLTGLVFEYLAKYPWTGSNYAGLYLLYEQLNGSAATHNQLTDVLLRTGAIGFALYAWLVFRVLQFFRKDKGIFFGLVAILIYGMFHETFKLGHGAFLFGFLLSYQYWMRRQEASAQ
jgi:hypothetical protein